MFGGTADFPLLIGVFQAQYKRTIRLPGYEPCE
jgi:hypothetical protein